MASRGIRQNSVLLISKSDFRAGMQCPKRLFLAKTGVPGAPVDETGRRRMMAGEVVGKIARSRYANGFLVPPSSGDLETALLRSAEALQSDAEAVFEATFADGDVSARLDILERTPTGGWNLIEVKSSSSIKPEHITDAAFQYWVATSAGCQIERVFVEVVNREYLHDDNELDPARFLVREDVTEKAMRQLLKLQASAAALVSTIKQGIVPEIRVNSFCKNPPCPYLETCHSVVGKDDLIYLPEIRHKKVDELRAVGIESYFEIPAQDLSAVQTRFVQGERSGERYVSDQLAIELASWANPIVAIDFEAVGSLLPLWPGTRPYQTIPFQWSAHTFFGPWDDPSHSDFLATGSDDPRPAFAAKLYEAIESAGTVLFYSDYERRCLRELAEAGILKAQACLDILNRRGVDLYAVLKRHVYLPSFGGSYSMKKVLPGLLGYDPYQDATIQNGDFAAMEFQRMLSPGTTIDEKNRISASLKEYCRLDTMAMVVVVRGLFALSTGDELEPELLALGLLPS